MENQDNDEYWESSNISANLFLEDSIEKDDRGFALSSNQAKNGLNFEKPSNASAIISTPLHKSSSQVYTSSKYINTPNLTSPTSSSQSASAFKKNLGLLNSLRKNHSFSSSPLNLQLPKLSALNFPKYSAINIGSNRRASVSSNASLPEQDEFTHDIHPTFLTIIDQIILNSISDDYASSRAKRCDSVTCLTRFKTKLDKCKLLDAALYRSDGNTTLKILIHLKNTLSSTIFLEVIGSRPAAVRQYVSYLRKTGETEALLECLRTCSGVKAATMAEMELATKLSDQSSDLPLAAKIQRLTEVRSNLLNSSASQKLSSEPSTKSRVDDDDTFHLSCYLSLLKRQFTLYQLDLSNSVTVPESEHEKLLDSSLVDTTRYCLMYHHADDSISPTSAHSIFEEYRPSPKIVAWTSLMALAKHQKWPDFDSVVTSKSYIFKQRITLQPKQILDILAMSRSPKEVIRKYVELLLPPEDQSQMMSRYII